jgi:phosphoribosylglycinamide formyltransferase 1
MPRILTVAIFVSGEGTTFEALAERIDSGGLPARIALVVSDRPAAPAIERARRRGVDAELRPLRDAGPGADWALGLSRELDQRGVELVVLAGFLSVLPKEFVSRWPGRIINVHPSLLPKFGGPGMYGHRVHEAVLRSGDPETGVTVHLVTEAVDAGPILAQVRVPVRADDTPDALRARLHPVEVEALAATILRFAGGELPLPARNDREG